MAVPFARRIYCVHLAWFPYIRNGKTAYSGVIRPSSSSAEGKNGTCPYSEQIRSRSRMKSTLVIQDDGFSACSTVLSARNRVPNSLIDVYPFSSDSLESQP